MGLARHVWPAAVRVAGSRERSRSRSQDSLILDEDLVAAVLPQASASPRMAEVPRRSALEGSPAGSRLLLWQPSFLRAEGWSMSRELLAACMEVLEAHLVQVERGVVPDLSDFYVRAADVMPGVVHVEYGRYRQAGFAVWAHRPPSPNSSVILKNGSQMSMGLVGACVRLWHCGAAAVFGDTGARLVASPRVLRGYFSVDFVRIEFDRSFGQAVPP